MRGSPGSPQAKRNKGGGVPQKGEPGYRSLETIEESLANSIFRANKQNTRIKVGVRLSKQNQIKFSVRVAKTVYTIHGIRHTVV